MDVELPLIKQQYDGKKIKVMPLLITNLNQRGRDKIKWIFDLQTYPNDTKPLIDYYNIDVLWENMKVENLDGIETKIDSILNSTPPAIVIDNREVIQLTTNLVSCTHPFSQI